ncbi:MAG: Trk family potassium uptake protein [Candidatus Brocadiaceae bacterium]|nr:Trk family potassium uptake protein [Candidatus Brocadiaceae bacterium]
MKSALTEKGRMLLALAFRRGAPRAAVSSFALVILLGAIVLTLPISSRSRGWTGPADALFTATSAVCVTGLLVKSTPEHWSLFGQLAILAMIQVGGLGIMTMGAVLYRTFQRRVSMRVEVVLEDIVETGGADSIWELLRFMCLLTAVVELLGAVVLYVSWRNAFHGSALCVYHSVFHSISAFCNAGFSLNDDSLVRFGDSTGVNLTVCGLIVVGGLGFPVVRDLLRAARWRLFSRRGRRVHLSTHSKLALTMTGILLVTGFVAVFLLEFGGTMAGVSVKSRILMSGFQSVTARTAGFNTVDITRLAPAMAFVLMALMYIGGSPSGTAGGIKTTTLGVMIASIVATLRGRSTAEVFHHSVPAEVVHRVASIILLSMALVSGSIFLLLITEDASFLEVAFDSVSAFGTVGLSAGLTGPDAHITTGGKLIITLLMFAGRLGPITLVLSMAQRKDRATYRYPEGQILVG